MTIFKTEIEVLDFLASLGMGLYGGYDQTLDCEYWYIAMSGRNGRMEYKSLNHQDCISWVNVKALEALRWADELQAMGKGPEVSG